MTSVNILLKWDDEIHQITPKFSKNPKTIKYINPLMKNKVIKLIREFNDIMGYDEYFVYINGVPRGWAGNKKLRPILEKRGFSYAGESVMLDDVGKNLYGFDDVESDIILLPPLPTK